MPHKILLMLLMLIFISGCAPKRDWSISWPKWTHTDMVPYELNNSAVVEADFVTTWVAVLLVMDRLPTCKVEKADLRSKTIIVDFTIGDAQKYMDCGTVTREDSELIKSTSSRIEYWMEGAKNRDAEIMYGKMTIVFEDELETKTRVTINNKYTMRFVYKSERTHTTYENEIHFKDVPKKIGNDYIYIKEPYTIKVPKYTYEPYERTNVEEGATQHVEGGLCQSTQVMEQTILKAVEHMAEVVKIANEEEKGKKKK